MHDIVWRSTHPPRFQNLNLKPDCQRALSTGIWHRFYSLNILKYKDKDIIAIIKKPKKKITIMLLKTTCHKWHKRVKWMKMDFLEIIVRKIWDLKSEITGSLNSIGQHFSGILFTDS